MLRRCPLYDYQVEVALNEKYPVCDFDEELNNKSDIV
jgi:hypothetical protein